MVTVGLFAWSGHVPLHFVHIGVHVGLLMTSLFSCNKDPSFSFSHMVDFSHVMWRQLAIGADGDDFRQCWWSKTKDTVVNAGGVVDGSPSWWHQRQRNATSSLPFIIVWGLHTMAAVRLFSWSNILPLCFNYIVKGFCCPSFSNATIMTPTARLT